MSVVHAQLRRYLRRLLAIQALLIAAAAGATYLRYGLTEFRALTFGGAIAMTGTLILMWYGWRAERAGSGLARNASLIYGSAIVRFFTTLALFAMGIAVLKFSPLPLFAGFILGLLGQLISTVLVPGNNKWQPKP